MHCRKERHEIDWHIGAGGGEYRRIAAAFNRERKKGCPTADRRVELDAIPEVVIHPGNNVQVGQSLMAIRSLRDIWVDANFKETQLRNLRIGQRVDLEVDMYGGKRVFEGRISGFTMGTGSTLALLPAQNATGNFVKVVQRLPVRIDVKNYDPDKLPLFVGLSVTPTVDLRAAPTGPNAGKFLQEPSQPGASATP
jgi:membrane fusion protein, multidrug efflux system